MEELFSIDNIFVDVPGENFKEVLYNVAGDLHNRNVVNEGYEEAVLDREKVFPTGLEFPKYCIAIPHTDSKYINKDAIAVVKPANKIVFRDMATNSKNLEVEIFLLLLISENENQVKVLSSVIRNFADEEFYNNLLETKDKNQILNFIKTKEK